MFFSLLLNISIRLNIVYNDVVNNLLLNLPTNKNHVVCVCVCMCVNELFYNVLKGANSFVPIGSYIQMATDFFID